MDSPANGRTTVKDCHLCKSERIYYLFTISGNRAVRCEDCGLVFLNPQPSEEELTQIHRTGNLAEENREAGYPASSEVKRAAAGLYLSEIRRYRGAEPGRLLEIGCGDGDFLAQAEAGGWQVTGIEYSPEACEKARQRLKRGEVHAGQIQQAKLASEQFDLCVVSDGLAGVRSPLDFLAEIHRVLKPGGVLFVATPSTDSWPARIQRQKWREFKAGHLTFYDRQTLQTALFKSGFHEVVVQPVGKIVPQHLDRLLSQFAASRITVFSRKTAIRSAPVLSVIVPAYNEAATLGTLLKDLLQKELRGLQMEVIVVESNSTDGTRAVALEHKNHPKVKLILEDQPRGKGHAVRTGLKAATGDYVLIQDADLEYDLEDYDALLEEIVASRCAFVLGSRHGGRNVLKMRQFAGQYGLSLFFNMGHWFFTTLINVLFWQHLRDPFTMYKVFRRDCLFGLEFECNRFDFDYELLIKLIRKGYRPTELPVNYRSRSYKEGKKVRIFSDPIQWLKVLVWLRWLRIDPMEVVERSRNHSSKSRT